MTLCYCIKNFIEKFHIQSRHFRKFHFITGSFVGKKTLLANKIACKPKITVTSSILYFKIGVKEFKKSEICFAHFCMKKKIINRSMYDILDFYKNQILKIFTQL
jgi:hypothetical protein